MDETALAKVTMLNGDITDEAAFARAVSEHGITHIIHLAALQVPFVRANPILGARVNVAGTAIVLETARAHAGQVRGLAYASSIAVYGLAKEYPPGPLAHTAPLNPTTLYGVTKAANENWAKRYWEDWGIGSIGLRPAYVYGPGRDQGMTSTPTKAMVAAAVGQPYEISFAGPALMQHADDVAAMFIRAARAEHKGAAVYNLGGNLTTIAGVIAAIERAAPDMAGKITTSSTQLPFPADYDETELRRTLGPVEWRPLDDGVRQTIDLFRTAAAAGRLDVARAMG